MTEIVLPALGDGVAKYSTFSAFPATANDGDLAIALDTDTLYTYNASGHTWVLIGPAGNTSTYVVDEFTLSSTDITNKYVTLSSTPNFPAKAVLEVIGGPTQSYSADYTISGTQLSWSGLFLDGVLEAGDQLIVQYY